ncbi:UDP-glucosyltransferase 2-like [Epargyreus clarus]|uniref:UDP-glucosyltransferase 2-like n=1 Tax=Epargyreus clarus TaxID=520877 RepID=UPI003C2D8242
MDYFVLTVLLIIGASESARILAVFPTPSISHQVVYRTLTQELVKRGHEVVVITTDPAYPPGETPENLTEIDVHDVSYDVWQKELLASDVGKLNNINNQVKLIVQLFSVIVEKQLQMKAIQDIIRNKKNITFDLLLLEACVKPALAFSHVYKAPVILISSNGPSLGIYEKLGIPTHPLLYPVIPRQKLYNLTYWEKVKEWFNYYLMEYIYNSLEYEDDEMLKKYFGPDIPPLSELYNNVDMLFQNIHPVFMDNVPIPSSVIYLGGLHQVPEKPLPEDLSSYLNNSKSGVIYVSFGTNVKLSLLPAQKIKMMINVFSKLPYDVLWKVDTKKLSGLSSNIKISQWFPQADLLRHPKIKAYVTQGGQQSTDEAITAGVPLIGVPMFGDQWFNVEKYVRHKIGLKLDWDSLTEEEFITAILTVTEDSSYRENVNRLRAIINDQPQTAPERAVWWTEHVLRHGGAKHLRAPAANISWAEYYEVNLDLSSYLNSSKSGVIYVSFGKNVKLYLLPPQKIKMMIKVFSKLPYDILWKVDNKKLSGLSSNIKISEWFPQADLLRHPQIKAYVTQGGQQSTDEAITAGVPLIGVPIFADQWFNVEKYVLRHKIGIKLDWDSLTEEGFRAAILNVTEDSSYRENIKRLRTIINDQPQTALERAIWWIEHVLRHGGAKHLRAPAVNMSWAEYYELDLVIIVISILIAALLSSLLFFNFLWFRVSKILKMVKNKTT